MANHQKSLNKRKIDQMVLNLSHSSRHELISSLTNLSALLQSNKVIPEKVKARISEKIDDSMCLLVELSPFEPIRSTKDSEPFEEMVFNQLIVELTRAERSAIVDHLIDIRDAVQVGGLFSDEIKRDLVAESKRIINQLLELPGKGESKTDSAESKENASDKLHLSTEKRVADSNSNEELDWKAVAKSQEEQIASLAARMDELKSELKLEIKEVDINRAEVSFKFKIAGVAKFFEIDGNERTSERFWCRGMQWSLNAECKLKEDQSKYLALYLFCHDNPALKANCRMILFDMSEDPDRQDGYLEFEHDFVDNTGIGEAYFISYLDLIDEANGYLMDDTIVLGVELETEQLVRE